MQLFVDNLSNIDFSYLHPARGLLGETWLSHIQLDGALDAQGMVCDFSTVKKTLKNWLDSEIDHRLLVPSLSEHLILNNRDDDYIELKWRFGDSTLTCISPRQAITLVNATEITPATVAKWSMNQLKPIFPDSVTRLSLDFTLEEISSAHYQYSHGLKKHDGNCQRIAHGHRSRIGIWENGHPNPALEHDWANKWRDIYIGTREDLVREWVEQGKPYFQFSYEARQGQFELIIPQENCYIMETDSTVEFIARHIAQCLKNQSPNSTFKVKAFEGLDKGAVAER